MSGLLATPASCAAAVERSTRELAARLQELNQAGNPIRKLQLAPFVAAAFFELTQHQAEYNQAVTAELAGLAAHVAALKAQVQSLAIGGAHG